MECYKIFSVMSNFRDADQEYSGVGVEVSNGLVQEGHPDIRGRPPCGYLRGRVYQAEEAASTKALRWDWAWSNQGSPRMPVWLQQSVQG